MGLGSQIFPNMESKVSISMTFRFEPELDDMMNQSIEMGRAFIIKEYQQKPMPLFLLWKGIIHTTLRFRNTNTFLVG
jgi:hypothetical protein